MSDMEYESVEPEFAGGPNYREAANELIKDEQEQRLARLFDLKRPIETDADLAQLGELFPEDE